MYEYRTTGCAAGSTCHVRHMWVRTCIPASAHVWYVRTRPARWLAEALLTGVMTSHTHITHEHTRTRAHAPADVRPDRPARWLADALLTGVMTSDSMPVRGLYEFCLLKPGSMTYLRVG